MKNAVGIALTRKIYSLPKMTPSLENNTKYQRLITEKRIRPNFRIRVGSLCGIIEIEKKRRVIRLYSRKPNNGDLIEAQKNV